MNAYVTRPLTILLVVLGLGAMTLAGTEPPNAPDDATKAALEDIQREADRLKAERAEQLQFRRRVARHTNPVRPPGLFGINPRQVREQQRQLNAALRNRPAATVGRLLGPAPGGAGGPIPPAPAPRLMVRPFVAGPGGVPPQVQVFQGPNGGGFLMRWGF